MEDQIKKKKRAVLKERQLNSTLKEENKSLSTTNKFLNQQDLTTTASSFTINARVAENIYENFIIKDLKADLERIQEQINQSNFKNQYKLGDIETIKKDNKALKVTIEEVKKYKQMLDLKVQGKVSEKESQLSEFAYRR